MKRVKKGRSCYSIGGVVLDENQPITQPMVPQSQVSNFLASVRPDASTIGNSDLGFAASQSAQDGVHRGATAIQSPSSFSQSAGIIGGPRYEPLNPLDNGSNSLVGQSQGQQPQAQQQLAPRGSFVDYMGGRLGNNNNSVSSLQAAAAEDANKRIKNILSGPYRYDRAGNRKYLGGNPYSPSLVAAATPSPLGYGEQDRANRRRTTVPAVPYGYEEKSYSNGGIVEGASEALLRKMAEKYGIANPPPEPMRSGEVKPQAVQQKKPEPPRRGFRTAERWREGGDYPIDVKYADGGIVAFKGKGGPREDKIPVTVAGEKIMVSNGEKAVILPAKTAANPAALGIIGGLIEHTNDGRKPKMGMRDGGKYARGAIPDDEELRRTGSPIGSPLTIFGGSRPITAQEMYNYGPKASVTVPPGTVGGDLTASGRHGDAVEGGSITNLAPVLRAIKTTGATIGNVFSDSAAAQQQGTNYDAARSARIAKEAEAAASAAQSKQPATIGNEGRGAGISAAVDPIAVQRAVTQPQPSGSRAIDGGMTVSQMGAGFDPTKLQMAPGYGMASNAAGKTIGGNMSPNQYVAADGTPGARWDETQQYKDAIARNERMKLELAAIQAGKKRGADPMAIQTAQQGIAGATIGNQAKQEEMQRNDQSNALLKTAMNTKDPAQHRVALQNYLASRGVAMKDPDEWEIMAGGERSVPNGLGGFQVVKDPPIAFHKPTRQWIKADGSIGQDGGATQTAQQADDIKAQMQAGKITRDQAIAELRKIGYQ